MNAEDMDRRVDGTRRLLEEYGLSVAKDSDAPKSQGKVPELALTMMIDEARPAPLAMWGVLDRLVELAHIINTEDPEQRMAVAAEFQSVLGIAKFVLDKTAYENRDIPHTLQIASYMHCNRCIDDMPVGESPRSWAQLEVGFTPLGLQVWCKRHECNVAHIDFQMCRHPANLTCHEERKP